MNPQLTPLQNNNLVACLNRAELRLIQGTSRQTHLEQMNAQQLRLVAASHGLPRPEGGWIDAVPYILEFEGLRQVIPNPPGTTCPCVPPERQMGLASRNYEHYSQQTAASSSIPRVAGWRFTTEYYKAIGLPTCTKCGEQAPRLDSHGFGICAIANPATCPVLTPVYP